MQELTAGWYFGRALLVGFLALYSIGILINFLRSFIGSAEG